MASLRNVGLLLVTATVLSGLSCSSQKQFKAKPLITAEEDEKSISQPKKKDVNLYQDGFENTVVREINDFADLSLHIRKLTDNPKEALNVNALDEVPNSSWFTNRHAKKPLTLEELKRGPDQGTGPDRSQPWTVVGAKVEGVSPGFTIRDGRGDIYFIKFDIRGYPQLNTAAEVISTKFTYAAGYNTPENYLSVLDPKSLKLAEDVTIPNRWGREIPMTPDYLQEVLLKVNPNPDGTYRVVASKLLKGKPIGPFEYVGTRKDNPNDHIPHNKRRELRGYKVVAAWLNNDDSKANNSLDMYVEEDGHKFVKHYLIDFASSLGSSGYGAAARARGQVGGFDLGHMLKKIFSLGLWVEGWEKAPRLITPSVGFFESRLFKPHDYAQLQPNPAFQRATNLDGFWGAKLVMSFTDEQIRAIVETGEYANQADADYIAKTLIERRDKTGRYWYGRVNPLDNFRVSGSSNGQPNEPVISFDDLSVAAGFEEASQTSYRYRLRYRGKDVTDYREFNSTRLAINSDVRQARDRILGQKQLDDDRIVTFKIQTKRGPSGSWSKYLQLHVLCPSDAGGDFQIIAIERQSG